MNPARIFKPFLFLLAAAALTGCQKSPNPQAPAKAPEPVTFKVGAAADLHFAFEELGSLFEKQTGKKPVFVFGSTGQLAQQISNGAPFDLFAAANVSFVDDVIAAGACLPDTKAMYARGRIVIWTPKDSTIPAPEKIEALTGAAFQKIAIANPEHAPYGKAAKQAMESTGTWEAIEPKLVYGENVRQTLQFAESGNVEAAVVALSLAIVTPNGVWELVPEELHKPIDQALAACTGGGNVEAGKEFARFINSPEGRAVMKRYGFVLPGEPVAHAP